MMLAAWELGLGTCWIGTMDGDKAKELLNIPEELHLLTVIPLGFPEKISKPPPRKPLKDMVHYEKYGKKTS